MSEPITSITSGVISEAQLRFQHPVSWPDPASGFAFRLLQAAGLPLPSAYQETLRPAGANLLRRSPDLAAFGYVIRAVASPQVQSEWSQAFARLVGREVFTPDRNSFIFNPLELLGIAFGACDCPAITDEQRRWLTAQIDRGLDRRHIAGTLHECFAQCARQIIFPARIPTESPVADLAQCTTTSELCMMIALGILCPGPATLDIGAIEHEIIRRALVEPIPTHDAAEAAAVYVTLRRSIDRALRAPNIDSDPVEHVVALCRRFQFFVDRLQHRQRSRPSFSVKDEYDVQDLLHAVLKLHFDDVRPEEWTPSYAGNSSRVDFYLKRERTIVEAKMTRKGLDQKGVANQLIIDKERYSAVDYVDKLVCFVYDPDRRCSNPAALETDLAQSSGRLRVAVVVCPVGI